ncbi:MAG: hypothetical protein JW802_06875 [Campylobacterales bacterium]|nr:hypothetical protein [Campylobacterales bacterium]
MLMIDKKDGVLYTEITGESMQVLAELALLVATVHEEMKEHIDVYDALNDPRAMMHVKHFLKGLKNEQEKGASDDERANASTESKG